MGDGYGLREEARQNEPPTDKTRVETGGKRDSDVRAQRARLARTVRK